MTLGEAVFLFGVFGIAFSCNAGFALQCLWYRWRVNRRIKASPLPSTLQDVADALRRDREERIKAKLEADIQHMIAMKYRPGLLAEIAEDKINAAPVAEAA